MSPWRCDILRPWLGLTHEVLGAAPLLDGVARNTPAVPGGDHDDGGPRLKSTAPRPQCQWETVAGLYRCVETCQQLPTARFTVSEPSDGPMPARLRWASGGGIDLKHGLRRSANGRCDAGRPRSGTETNRGYFGLILVPRAKLAPRVIALPAMASMVMPIMAPRRKGEPGDGAGGSAGLRWRVTAEELLVGPP